MDNKQQHHRLSGPSKGLWLLAIITNLYTQSRVKIMAPRQRSYFGHWKEQLACQFQRWIIDVKLDASFQVGM